jgi:hypothetical protein
MIAHVRSTFCFILLMPVLAACDSNDPVESAPVEGNYAAEWVEGESAYSLTLDVTNEGGQLTGTSGLTQRRGTISGGRLIMPLNGSQRSERISFSTGDLTFSGEVLNDSVFTGRIAGSVFPFLEGPSEVGAEIAFTRTE